MLPPCPASRIACHCERSPPNDHAWWAATCRRQVIHVAEDVFEACRRHWGAEARLEPAALKLLIDAYPQGIAMKDAYGFLPRELAAHGVQSMLQ